MNLVRGKKPHFSFHNTKRVFPFTAPKVVEAKQKLLDIEWSDGWVYGVDTVTLVLLPRLMRGQATVLRWTNLIIDGLQNNAELLGKVFLQRSGNVHRFAILDYRDVHLPKYVLIQFQIFTSKHLFSI